MCVRIPSAKCYLSKLSKSFIPSVIPSVVKLNPNFYFNGHLNDKYTLLNIQNIYWIDYYYYYCSRKRYSLFSLWSGLFVSVIDGRMEPMCIHYAVVIAIVFLDFIVATLYTIDCAPIYCQHNNALSVCLRTRNENSTSKHKTKLRSIILKL